MSVADKIAKNLLAGLMCDGCVHFHAGGSEDKNGPYIHNSCTEPNRIYEPGFRWLSKLLPKERTCEHFRKS